MMLGGWDGVGFWEKACPMLDTINGRMMKNALIVEYFIIFIYWVSIGGESSIGSSGSGLSAGFRNSYKYNTNLVKIDFML